MKLLRNCTEQGAGKYSLIQNVKGGRIEHGAPGTRNEFFVVMLKDENAHGALLAYANEAACNGDMELSREVKELVKRAGKNSQWCKKPD